MRILIEFRDHRFGRRPWLPFFWKTWIPTLALEQHFVFWRQTIGKKESAFVLAAFLYFIAAISMLGPLTVTLGVAVYLVAVEVINFPHHLGLPQHGGESTFKPYEQTAFCRSCDYPRWFAHLALLNFNLHIEHHLFPAHPWHQLDKINRDLEDLKFSMNRTKGNKWIRINRQKELDHLLAKTFEDGSLDEGEIRAA